MHHHKYSILDYEKIRKTLCVDKTEEGFKKRVNMFKSFDPNGNGILSLAECDKGIRDVLRLPDLFDSKEVIMRAFQAAKNCGKKTSKYSDDYIERNEFRVFLCYLRQYFEYHEMFEAANKDGDHSIDYKEFVAAIPKFEKWGIKVTDPEATFKEIDLDNGGKIRFPEFCHWAIKNNLDIDTDDDFRDDCLKNLK
jgi:Ca2+-binding EF-hand superfamily protein